MNVPRGVSFSCDDLMRGPLSAGAVAALRAHPLLSNAVIAAAGALVAIRRRPPVIINDLGRFIIGNLALYLHYSRDPGNPRSGFRPAVSKPSAPSRMSAVGGGRLP